MRDGWSQRPSTALVESPRDWATYRDAQLKRMKWTDDRPKRGENHANCRTTPVWEAKEVKSKVVKAYLGIFADDILVVGEHGVLTQVMQDLQRVFYMSP